MREAYAEALTHGMPRMEWYFDEVMVEANLWCPRHRTPTRVLAVKRASPLSTEMADVVWCPHFRKGKPRCNRECLAFLRFVGH